MHLLKQKNFAWSYINFTEKKCVLCDKKSSYIVDKEMWSVTGLLHEEEESEGEQSDHVDGER